ncbi:response regulator [Terriglobus sp. 2YAB30_2]|uniref:response regulator n=1 Tax=Terriglobus sp. 2YAB30_2 TaxID=3233023 RepID=UPI003F9D7FA4
MQNSPLILCVDDEAVGLRIRSMLLERAGYRVLSAPDGASGLSLLAAHPVEAVILDYSMPGMDGDEVARQMRAMRPGLPILLLSAYVGLPADATANVSLYMTKGEGAPALLANLKRLFSDRSPQ